MRRVAKTGNPMSAREDLLEYVKRLPVEDDDALFKECLKVLAEGVLEHIANLPVDDPVKTLKFVCAWSAAPGPEDEFLGPTNEEPSQGVLPEIDALSIPPAPEDGETIREKVDTEWTAKKGK
jgi:hypothetical protein